MGRGATGHGTGPLAGPSWAWRCVPCQGSNVAASGVGPRLVRGRGTPLLRTPARRGSITCRWGEHLPRVRPWQLRGSPEPSGAGSVAVPSSTSMSLPPRTPSERSCPPSRSDDRASGDGFQQERGNATVVPIRRRGRGLGSYPDAGKSAGPSAAGPSEERGSATAVNYSPPRPCGGLPIRRDQDDAGSVSSLADGLSRNSEII